MLKEINKRAKQNNRVIPVLLQLHIAEEETKYGLSHEEMIELLSSEQLKEFENVKIVGLMGIATNTPKQKEITEEFKELYSFFDGIKKSYFRKDPDFKELSMGMTSDFHLALKQGSTMIRVGTKIFGARYYLKANNEKA